MNLKNLIGNSKDLVYCSHCPTKTTWELASKAGWTMDMDAKEDIYCAECKSFLVNKLDENDTL